MTLIYRGILLLPADSTLATFEMFEKPEEPEKYDIYKGKFFPYLCKKCGNFDISPYKRPRILCDTCRRIKIVRNRALIDEYLRINCVLCNPIKCQHGIPIALCTIPGCSRLIRVYCYNCKKKEETRKEFETFFSQANAILPFLRTNVCDPSPTDMAYNHEGSLPMII